MLRRPHLLVLDEATSAIDVEGEHAILGRLLRVRPRSAIVTIAHRVESLRHYERVLLFDGRRLVSDRSSIACTPGDGDRNGISVTPACEHLSEYYGPSGFAARHIF
jgi:energy-coupling factor transporter ATP-binding protein EcfA2